MRKLAAVSLSLSAAVFFWRYGVEGLTLLGCVLCLAGVAVSLHPKAPGTLRAYCLLALLGLMLGFGWCTGFAARQVAPWQARHGEKGVVLEARVEEWPEENTMGVPAVRVTVWEEDGTRGTSGMLYLPGGEAVRPGDRVRLTGRLYAGDRLSRREVRFFTADGVFLRVYAEEVLSVTPHTGVDWRHLPLTLSRWAEERFSRLMPENCAGLARALVLGDKAGLSEEFTAMSRRAGLTHVLVVSGMHISFLAGLLQGILGRRRVWWQTVLLIGAFCLFALIAGGTPSAWRAVILCSAGLVADLVGRENDPVTTLSAALMLLLLQNPCAAASVSLQLSFAAVAGIQLFTPRLLERWQTRRDLKASRWARRRWLLRRWVVSTLSVSLGATVFTAPLSAAYFGTISLVAPLSNLFCLWLVSLAFQGSVLTVLLPGVLGELLSMLTQVPLNGLLFLVPRLGRLPFAAVTTTSVYYRVAFAVGWVLLCLWLWKRERNGRRFPIPLLCCGGVFLCALGLYRAEFALSGLTTAVLDVGQGQAVCLERAGVRAVVDCGGSDSVSAGDRVADFLADRGITEVDYLILTHYHADHAGGVERLLERVMVKHIYLPDTDEEEPLRQTVLERVQEKNIPVNFVTENTVLPLGGAELTLYAPLGDGGSNERGLAVLAGYEGWDVLVTGDMNNEVESRLVKYGALPKLEVLVAGHHGSKYSTGYVLLGATEPERAVISVGEFNSYGHPAPEVMARLEEFGAAIYRTDREGTVVIHGRGR